VDQQITDRRTDTRLALSRDSVRVTLRPGCTVHIVDVSPGGALVQGERPLRPGSRVHMHVVSRARTFAVAARVLRCAVWALHPMDGVTYRGALQFENRCELFWEPGTRPGAQVPGAAATDPSGTGQPLPAMEKLLGARDSGNSK
jgi:PilZ domain